MVVVSPGLTVTVAGSKPNCAPWANDAGTAPGPVAAPEGAVAPGAGTAGLPNGGPGAPPGAGAELPVARIGRGHHHGFQPNLRIGVGARSEAAQIFRRDVRRANDVRNHDDQVFFVDVLVSCCRT